MRLRRVNDILNEPDVAGKLWKSYETYFPEFDWEGLWRVSISRLAVGDPLIRCWAGDHEGNLIGVALAEFRQSGKTKWIDVQAMMVNPKVDSRMLADKMFEELDRFGRELGATILCMITEREPAAWIRRYKWEHTRSAMSRPIKDVIQ